MILRRPSADVDASARHNDTQIFDLALTFTLTHDLDNISSSSNLGIEYMYVI